MNTDRFTTAVKLTLADEGGFVVTCRDYPELITQGENETDALAAASDALDVALACRIAQREDIPEPADAVEDGEILIYPSAQFALKSLLYLAAREAAISNAELARRMHVHEKEARRVLDPHHGTKLARLEHALRVLGKRVQISVN